VWARAARIGKEAWRPPQDTSPVLEQVMRPRGLITALTYPSVLSRGPCTVPELASGPVLRFWAVNGLEAVNRTGDGSGTVDVLEDVNRPGGLL